MLDSQWNRIITLCDTSRLQVYHRLQLIYQPWALQLQCEVTTILIVRKELAYWLETNIPQWLVQAQLRTNKSLFPKSYLHKVDAKSHPSPLCLLCNTHTHDTHHLFNCTHIRTTLSPLELWTDPAGVMELLTRWTYYTHTTTHTKQHRSKRVQPNGSPFANNHCSTRYEQSFRHNKHTHTNQKAATDKHSRHNH